MYADSIVQLVISISEEDAAPQIAPKPAWHAPVITRINIKRTMHWKGSGADSANFDTKGG
ncbi:hypothetical protein D4R89_13900 [bacterium]|nr:MAG: hypothetical protein D4R89_13900 [bacterium]